MKKRASFKKFLKIGIASLASVVLLGSTTMFLTSCSSKDSLTEDDLVSTGTGKIYTENKNDNITLDIKQNFQNALLNRAPLTSATTDMINNAWLSIIEQIIDKDKADKFKIDRDREWKKIDTQYDDLVKNLKDSNPDDWELVLQKDTLDANGGTEQTYKNRQKLAWASSYLTNAIFEKSYLKVRDPGNNNNNLSIPTKDKIFIAANNVIKSDGQPSEAGDPYFTFDARSSNNEATTEDKLNKNNLYAAIQEFVFDLWIKIQQPFVVNMSLWKYSQPKEGIEQYYKIPSAVVSTSSSSESTNSEGGESSEETPPAPTATSSYAFPYFQNGEYDATNDTLTTVSKFQKFVEAAGTNQNFLVKPIKKNPTDNIIQNNTIGLIDIPQQYTEDSSTYILAKRETIFNDLYPEFAAASIALLEDKNMPSQAVDGSDKQQTEFDTITSNFVKTTQSANATKIDSKITAQIFNKDGFYKQYGTGDLYSLDAFKATGNLDKFAFLRNQAGVHAIAIDGGTGIVGKTGDERFQGMKQPILYRAMLSQLELPPQDGTPVFSLDLKNELQSFFSSNIPLIMTTLLNSVTNDTFSTTLSEQAKASFKKYIKPNLMGQKDSDEQKVFELNQQINFLEKFVPQPEEVQNKMVSVKEPFNAAYGVDALNNGLSAQWVYTQSANGRFEIADSYIQQGGKNITDDDYSKPYEKLNDLVTKDYNNAVTGYINNLNTAGAFVEKKITYSQVIWANIPTDKLVDIVNTINYQYTSSNGTDFASGLKNQVLEKEASAIMDPIDIAKFKKDGIVGFKAGGNLTGDVTALQNSFFEYLADREFNKNDLKNKFNSFAKLMPANTISGTSFKITPDQLSEYKKQLYLDSFKTYKQTDIDMIKNSIYTAGLTLNYVLRDNGKYFINYVQNKVQFGNDAFIVWEDRFNSKLDNFNVGTTADTLNPTNRLIINVDNSLDGTYLSELTNTNLPATSNNVNNGTGKSLYGVGESHFAIAKPKATTEMLGYKGLQVETSNTLQSAVSNKLFNQNREHTTSDENDIYKGLLYKYGSKESLIARVKEMTDWTQIRDLINDIRKEIPLFDMDEVNAAEDTNKLKDIFEKLLLGNKDGTKPIIPPSAFEKFEGELTEKPFLENPTENTYKAAVYAEQLNYEDFRKKHDGSDVKTLDDLKTNIGDRLFYDLLMEYAFNETNQTVVVNEIASKHKFMIYDINAKNALGSKWVENWLLPSELKNKDK